MRKLTQSEFLERAVKKHGDTYDYSLVRYNGLKEFITIICKIHGKFQQRAGEHLRYGCNKCGNKKISDSKRLDTAIIIRKSKETHGNKYDYSKTNYIDCQTEITIGCKIHGFFNQLPRLHYRGSGCNDCATINRKQKQVESREDFIKKARMKHGDSFDYSKVEYQGSHVKVEIICPIHGSFFQTPASHKHGTSCRLCSFENNAKGSRVGIEEFTRRANLVHENKYDYSKSEYKSKDSPLIIICHIHGEFKQSPANHTRLKQGCPSCSTGGFNPLKDAHYYVNKILNQDGDILYFKGGISNDWKRRFVELEYGLPDNLSILHENKLYFKLGRDARFIESEIIRLAKKIGVKAPPRDFEGGHELFLKNPFEFASELFSGIEL